MPNKKLIQKIVVDKKVHPKSFNLIFKFFSLICFFSLAIIFTNPAQADTIVISPDMASYSLAMTMLGQFTGATCANYYWPWSLIVDSLGGWSTYVSYQYNVNDTGAPSGSLYNTGSICGEADIFRPIIKFNLSAIPENKVITGAELKFNQNNQDIGTNLRALFPLRGGNIELGSGFDSATSSISDILHSTSSSDQFTFNANGLRWLNENIGSLSAMSLMVRDSYDYDKIDPPGYNLYAYPPVYPDYFKNFSLQISYEDSASQIRLSNLGQFKSDGAAPIAEGATTTGSVVFQGTINNPVNNPTQLQIEVEPSNIAFTGVPTATSGFSSSNQTISVVVPDLPIGTYHWQARMSFSQGNFSVWQTMNNSAATIDFTVVKGFSSTPVSFSVPASYLGMMISQCNYFADGCNFPTLAAATAPNSAAQLGMVLSILFRRF
jgi:hypothetical protein